MNLECEGRFVVPECKLSFDIIFGYPKFLYNSTNDDAHTSVPISYM